MTALIIQSDKTPAENLLAYINQLNNCDIQRVEVDFAYVTSLGESIPNTRCEVCSTPDARFKGSTHLHYCRVDIATVIQDPVVRITAGVLSPALVKETVCRTYGFYSDAIVVECSVPTRKVTVGRKIEAVVRPSQAGLLVYLPTEKAITIVAE